MKTIVIALVFFALTLQANHSQGPSQLPPASEMKTLGLIGGTSWYSTVDYYRYINEAVNDAYGNSTNPPLILYNMNQEKIHELQAALRNSTLQGAYMILAARALGLDCGPMSGFDNAKLDEEFFAAGKCESCT
jgi:nitroreductase